MRGMLAQITPKRAACVHRLGRALLFGLVAAPRGARAGHASLRRPGALSTAMASPGGLLMSRAPLVSSLRCGHATVPAPEAPLNEQLDELMESFAEARALITDAMESVGTTYFADDMEDAEKQTAETLQRWSALQTGLEGQGAVEQLQRVRNMYELKIKQLQAELETVREAGGSG